MRKKLMDIRNERASLLKKHASIVAENYTPIGIAYFEVASLLDTTITTLDPILNMDESKVVERVAMAVKESQIQLMNNPPHPMCDMIVGARYQAKAALRALGLMKEGE